MPHRIASGAGSPMSAASLVITMPPSAMTMPHDRSMPAVRMISVWPIAITPTTITCCRISEKFSPLRKRSVCVAKKTQASSSAMKGPSVPSGGSVGHLRRRRRAWAAWRVRCTRGARVYFLPQHSSVPNLVSLLSTPAIGLAAISVTPVSV